MRRYLCRLIAVLAVAFAAPACSKVTYVDRTLVPTAHREQTGHFFLGGLVGETTVLAYQMCPSGVARVQSKFTFGDMVLSGLTLGIYSPRTYDVTCGVEL